MRSFPCFGAFALFSAASATIASNGKTMPCGSEICFDGVYSDNPPNYWTVNKGDPAETFLWNRDFWMYWLSTRNTKDQEVTFEWLMLDVPGSDNKTETVVWSQNSTKPQFSFQPHNNNSFWPTAAAPNFTHLEAIGYGSARNQFRISFAGEYDVMNRSTYDLSKIFHVKEFWYYDAWVMQIQHMEDWAEADKKDLKIRLGCGILAAWFVAFIGAWFLSAWFERRRLKASGRLFAVGNQKAGAFEQMR